MPVTVHPTRTRVPDIICVDQPPPVVLAYGMGVDSTALLVELEARGTPPDLVLTADTGAEKPETYAYQVMMAAWMAACGIAYEVVRYVPRRFKHWPQEKYLKACAPAQAAWARGQKVVRLIGFDASPQDTRRYTHAASITDDLFETRYPLRTWGWDRAACIARIQAAGLPVPPKSSCFICGAMKPDEVRALQAWCLRLRQRRTRFANPGTVQEEAGSAP